MSPSHLEMFTLKMEENRLEILVIQLIHYFCTSQYTLHIFM